MDKKELIKKITQKKEFSKIPIRDIEIALDKFYNPHFSEEEIVKKVRNFLRKIFSGFSGKKLMGWKEKPPEEILRKHLSTRERLEDYEEIYQRVLKNLPKKISIIDMGAGVNGFSYPFFKSIGKEVDYVAIEAIGQFVELTNNYFKKTKDKITAIHATLFDLEKIKEIVLKNKTPRIAFLFKVVDSLEKVERDYTKKLLEEIVPILDRVVISFPTESWMKRKKFHVQRKWLTDFIQKKWNFIDDFTIKGERYLVFEK